jgi:hypothetical protein
MVYALREDARIPIEQPPFPFTEVPLAVAV